MKIALCTPSHGHPNFRYVQSLGALLVRPAGHELRLFLQQRTPVSFNRNIIAKGALDWGADTLLWIDDDQTYPEDTLERLLKHGKAIVGCNIAMRSDPPLPTAVTNGDRVWTTAEKAAAGLLEEVDHIGLGVCLISAEVFVKIGGVWFDEARTEAGEPITEDVLFMRRARAAGFSVHVDHALSWLVGHVHQRTLFPVDTLPQT